MRPAGKKRMPVPTISATLVVRAPHAVAIADVPINAPIQAAAVNEAASARSTDPDARHRALESAIRERIETRLTGRVRNLVVRSFDELVILEGQCATYYTKQLAQHAAMGVLNDEHLENAIVVMVGQ